MTHLKTLFMTATLATASIFTAHAYADNTTRVAAASAKSPATAVWRPA